MSQLNMLVISILRKLARSGAAAICFLEFFLASGYELWYSQFKAGEATPTKARLTSTKRPLKHLPGTSLLVSQPNTSNTPRKPSNGPTGPATTHGTGHLLTEPSTDLENEHKS
jgi:hypothetical protein